MSTIADRAFRAINLDFFKSIRYPESCGFKELDLPNEEQYILRLLIEEPYSGIKLPNQYKWTLPIIREAKIAQKKMVGVRHPFTYLTIRHGMVRSENDDVWHTDGFSTRFNHLPEQNYIWVNNFPTEYTALPISFPDDFNSQFHNIHLFLQDVIPDTQEVSSLRKNYIYAMDPYVVHRRPKEAYGKQRTFLRVSFTPIEIIDKDNTFNPEIPRNYTRSGVKDFRDNLFRYEVI